MDDWNIESSKPHGHKRHADDTLESDQRLSKRFNLLNLEQNGKLYISVQPSSTERRKRSNAISDSMHLDDSRDRVYIKDLEEEVADIESEEEKLIFLPDIEKRLAKIPKSVLTGPGKPQTRNEIVLYSVPNSLSIPREQDKVRKAIIETRARARENQAQWPEVRAERDGLSGTPDWSPKPLGDNINSTSIAMDEDSDAMDLG